MNKREPIIDESGGLLTSRDVARLLGVSYRSVIGKKYRAGIGLKTIKIGRSVRFKREDIEALVESGTHEG